MGQTIAVLSEKAIEGKPIFDKRFVIEVCEAVHIHYRNLRIILSSADWKNLGKGIADAWKRYEARGCPATEVGTHIELCRKEVASDPIGDDSVKVNLNKNLYELNEGKIFAEGAELLDQSRYIHLKIRDLRVELTLSEFLSVADAIGEAKEKICALQS